MIIPNQTPQSRREFFDFSSDDTPSIEHYKSSVNSIINDFFPESKEESEQPNGAVPKSLIGLGGIPLQEDDMDFNPDHQSYISKDTKNVNIEGPSGE